VTASELAEKLNISTAMLRKWEKHFAEMFSADYKDGKTYTESGVQQFLVIKYLLDERGFTLEGALKEMQRQESLDGEQGLLIRKLQSLKDFLVDLKGQLS
jgi:DNA-binding transcriptional MerR regulator